MIHLSRAITIALSVSTLGLAIAACQPQGGTPSAEVAPPAEDITANAEAPSTEKSSQLMGAAEISGLVIGHIVMGSAGEFTWAQYFSPDGTTKSTAADDLGLSGTYYSNDQEEFCIDFPDAPWEQKVFCFKLVALGAGQYQQVLADGTKMGIYTQILQGEKLDAL